jgi:hypothetical protein
MNKEYVKITTCEAEVRTVDQERNERNHPYMDHASAHKIHFASLGVPTVVCHHHLLQEVAQENQIQLVQTRVHHDLRLVHMSTP